MNKKRILRSVVIIVAALAFSAALAYVQIKMAEQSTPPRSAAAQKTGAQVAGLKIGGAFTLTDHTGNTFTEQDLNGKYALIYFGFTFCPAICPTELQKITVALGLAGDAGDQVLPVFITVDPERDTRDVMAQYVAQFHDRMVGLTGTPEQVEQALKAYRVYARKVDDPAMTEYTMDHSSYIYLMSPNGELAGIYGVDKTPAEIADGIRAAINAGPSQNAQ